MTRTSSIKLAGLALLMLGLGATAGSGGDNRAPDLSGYEKLVVADGNKVAFVAYAEGVQIYRWNGTTWAFVGPEAVLYSGNGDDDGVVGIHYAGPTWESNSGSKVVGEVLERATPDPTAIPWLKLKQCRARDRDLPPGDVHPATLHDGRPGPHRGRRLRAMSAGPYTAVVCLLPRAQIAAA